MKNRDPKDKASASGTAARSRITEIVQKAATLCQNRQIDAAVKALDSHGKIALTDARGQCLLGFIHNSRGKPEAALEAFDAAIGLDPKLPEAHNNRGNILKSLDRLDGALTAYDEAVALRPDYAEAHYNRGHALMRLDRLEHALAAYDTAISLRPAYPEAHNNRGNILKSLDRLDDALIAYNEALARNPAHASAHVNRGVVLNRLNRPEEALAAFDTAIKLQPGDAETHCNRGNLLKELGRTDEALAAFDQALKIQPGDLKAGNNRAALLGDIGRVDEALSAYDAVLTHDRTYSRALINRGTLLFETGRIDDAIEAFKSAMAQPGPYSMTTLYALSQLPTDLLKIDILPLIEQATPENNDNKEEFLALRAATRACAYDRAGRYRDAWDDIVFANQRPFRQKQADYLKSRTVRHKVLAWLQDGPRASLAADEPDHPVSLNILGTSRSGKTTMEKLAGTLERTVPGFEASIVEDALRQAFAALDMAYRKLSLELPEEIEAQWREHYLALLGKKARAAAIYTNTHPGNVRAAFHMAKILPNSRFVFMKRDFHDVCLRIYMKQYRSGNTYAYAIETIYEYVNWYNETIDALHRLLPGVSIVMSYEDMIAEPMAALEKTARLCGVEIPASVRKDKKLPMLGDDRGCGAPYMGFMPAPSGS